MLMVTAIALCCLSRWVRIGAAFAPFVFICCLCAHITQKETKNHKTNRAMKTKNKGSQCARHEFMLSICLRLLLLLLLDRLFYGYC